MPSRAGSGLISPPFWMPLTWKLLAVTSMVLGALVELTRLEVVTGGTMLMLPLGLLTLL